MEVKPSMRHLFRLWAPSLLLIISSTALAQQALIVAEDATSAKAFRPQVGKVITFVCPSNLILNREIWGTDVYLDESPICTAGVHAGVLTPGTSGQVTIVMGAGAQSFQGTQRNGVTSLNYGPWSSTYSFTKNSEAGQIDWHTTFDRVPDDFHTPITVLCPPNGNADTYVWGTDVYSAGSSICLAAVHAGIITLKTGGRVTVTLQPKQETFVASVRNSVSTQHWTGWDYQSYPQPYKVTPGTITVTMPTSSPARETGPRQAPSISSNPGPRTITLKGFIAAGAATPLASRAITLSGFSAAGTAPSLGPRIIQLRGFTAIGTAPPLIPRAVLLSGWTIIGTAP